MSLAFLFHYLMLNMFRMLLRPSSGAFDLFVGLFHGLYSSGSMRVGVTLCLAGVVWYPYAGFSLHPDTTVMLGSSVNEVTGYRLTDCSSSPGSAEYFYTAYSPSRRPDRLWEPTSLLSIGIVHKGCCRLKLTTHLIIQRRV